MRNLILFSALLVLGMAVYAVDMLGQFKKESSRPAKITSDMTFYDRKEGIVQFTGNVHVDDERFQMHSDKTIVFLEGTNDLSRIVALGHVALTNETRRAYGAKVSYYKDNGLVVLYSGDGIVAQVYDEKPDGKQEVRGEKIKFWLNSEQVEVVKAQIEAPAKGAKGVVPGFGL